MTGFHAAAACSPTRTMILTGTYHHIASLGNLIEWTDLSAQNVSKANNYPLSGQGGTFFVLGATPLPKNNASRQVNELQ